MGVKYYKEYVEIIEHFASGIMRIDDFYKFFDMTLEDWNLSSKADRIAFARTMADDLLYALGNEAEIELGGGSVKYVQEEFLIKIFNKNKFVCEISL
ncbi:MAG TPA: hypothetical protein VIK72_02415 [Clostridiaceae bacterium]